MNALRPRAVDHMTPDESGCRTSNPKRLNQPSSLPAAAPPHDERARRTTQTTCQGRLVCLGPLVVKSDKDSVKNYSTHSHEGLKPLGITVEIIHLGDK